jgi:voltage-gated potassium channel
MSRRHLDLMPFIPSELRSKTLLHLAAIVVVVVAGTLVFAAVDHQSLDASFYFIVMVLTLIGAANPTTFAGELVGIVVAVLSVGIVLSFMTQILGPAALAAYWEGHRVRKASRMKNHIVLCGYSDTARVLLNNLPKDEVLLVVKDKATVDALTERGAAAMQGDYETTEVLRKAGVAESRAVIAASEVDSENAFICLTSKKIAAHVPVYATVSSQENLEKLREVRADHIISPALLSADAILKGLGTQYAGA